MNLPTYFSSREKLFDFLDDYAAQRKEEIDQKDSAAKLGLIKSYVLETSHNTNGNTPHLFKNLGWQLAPIGSDDHLYSIQVNGLDFGYLETVSPRFLLIHSYQETSRADNTVTRIGTIPELDFLWLAGDYFNALWQNLVLPVMPEKLVSFRFEHESRFESGGFPSGDELNVEDQGENDETRKLEAEEITQRPVSTSTITEQARQIGKFLPALQAAHAPFRAVKMLRLPAAMTRGGYDFWSWGKITYRASSFREGRDQVLTVTTVYDRATRVIERKLWFYVESITLKEEKGGMLHGTPLVMEFSHDLSPATFRNLIDVTFERGEGPLRLWGNPIWLGENKVHVYGVDLHLWQRIYLELTPRRLVALLPRGTCGNTVHRLLTNFQRYIDPAVQLWIGDLNYSNLIRDVLLGKNLE